MRWGIHDIMDLLTLRKNNPSSSCHSCWRATMVASHYEISIFLRFLALSEFQRHSVAIFNSSKNPPRLWYTRWKHHKKTAHQLHKESVLRLQDDNVTWQWPLRNHPMFVTASLYPPTCFGFKSFVFCMFLLSWAKRQFRLGHDEFFKFQFDVIILSPAHQDCIPSGDQGHAESNPSVLSKVIEKIENIHMDVGCALSISENHASLFRPLIWGWPWSALVMFAWISVGCDLTL